MAGQRSSSRATLVVLIACAIVGTYLWIADLVFKRLVQNVLLRSKRSRNVPLVRHQHLLGP